MRVRVEVCPGGWLEGWLRVFCFPQVARAVVYCDNKPSRLFQRLLAAGQCAGHGAEFSPVPVVAGLHIRITWVCF